MNIKNICVCFVFILFNFTCNAAEALSKIQLENGAFLTYEQLLEANKLAGISLAVVDNYKTVFTYSGGKKEFSKKSQVNDATAFNAASISKTIVATLAVMLSEQGKLDLDAPVGNYLKRWKLPNSSLTKHTPITIRHLLTHTAGTTQSGYASNYLGEVIPSTLETLNTYKNKAISVVFEPGSSWKYSGGGYLIVQMALEDLTGKSIALLGDEMLFKPLNMKNTTFYQDGHERFPINIAKAHNDNRKVISTGVPICPEGACGLWTNAIDMAKLSIEIQKALSGRQTRVISQATSKMLVKVETTRLSGGWGLGWMRHLAVGNLDWFSHSGYNHGTGGLVMATIENGRGVFIFANGDYRPRVKTIEQIVSSVVKSMKWEKHIEASRDKPSQSLITRIVGEYENLTPHHFSPFARRLSIKQQGNSLVLFNSSTALKPLPLIHIGNNKFKVDQLVSAQIGFKVEQDGSTYLMLEQAENQLSSKALIKVN